jgi:hypothetical protein
MPQWPLKMTITIWLVKLTPLFKLASDTFKLSAAASFWPFYRGAILVSKISHDLHLFESLNLSPVNPTFDLVLSALKKSLASKKNNPAPGFLIAKYDN